MSRNIRIIYAITARKIIDLIEERLFGETNVQFQLNCLEIAINYFSLYIDDRKRIIDTQRGKIYFDIFF